MIAKNRQDAGQATDGFIEATTVMNSAVFDLALLLDAKDEPIESMARDLLAAALESKMLALADFAFAAAAWYRGQITAEEARSQYATKLANWRAKQTTAADAEDAEQGTVE